MQPARAAQVVGALLPLLLVSPLWCQPTVRNRGILVSEIHHGSLVTPGSLPSYIELINVDRFQPVVVAPPGGVIMVQTAGTPGQVSMIPAGTIITPATPGAPSPTLVIAETPTGAPFEILDPNLFSQGALTPGMPTRICISIPDATSPVPWQDQIVIGAAAGTTPCPGAPPFNGPGILPTGHVNRALFMDSGTHYDFETVTLNPSPGVINPEMGHINGFRWGTDSTGAPSNAGTLIPVGSNNIAQLMLSNEPVRAVLVPNHPQFAPDIADPLFDPVLQIGAVVNTNGSLAASSQILSGVSSGNVNWSLTVPHPVSAGVLTINQGTLIQAGVQTQLSPASPGSPRVVRFFSDLLTDATPSGSGNLSPAQVTLLPSSTGGGNIWCEMIIYDSGGNRYRAKVRNWPSNPQQCGGAPPNLGAGSNGMGNLDLVALCFPANTEIFILPSLALTLPTGSGPLFGINPDQLTLDCFALPVGAAPCHVTTDPEGLYLFSITAGVFSGISLDFVAIEYSPGSGFIAPPSPVVTISIL